MSRDEKLLALTSNKLVERHNELNPKEPLPYWKKPKQELVDIILDLEKRAEEKASAGRTIREAALELLCSVDYYEDKSKPPSKDNRVGADHPNARSVGLEYLEIIDRIVEEFPEAETSVACLRWYAVKVRAEEFGYEGYRLAQRRPRARPVR